MAYVKKNRPSVSERFSAEAKDATAKRPPKNSAGAPGKPQPSAGKKTNPGYYGQKKKTGLFVQAKRREDLASGRLVIPQTTQPTTPVTPKAKAARVMGPGSPAPKKQAWYMPMDPGKPHKKRKKSGDAWIG